MEERIKAGKFKAECLKIMDRVKKTHKQIIITKRNEPVAKLVPVERKETKFFGKLKGTIQFRGNIIDSIEEVWDADS